MSESFLKLYHFTPQTFVFEDDGQLEKYLSLIKTRLLSKPEIDEDTLEQYSLQGAFWIIDGDMASYFNAFNQVKDLPLGAKELLKLLQNKQRLVSSNDRNHFFGPNDDIPDAEEIVPCNIEDEDNLKNAISNLSEIDAFICSDEYYSNLTDPEVQIKQKSLFFSSGNDFGFWYFRSSIIEPNTLNALIDALATLLTFSTNITFYDTFLDPRETAYENFSEVLKVCGNPLLPAEVKIITGPKRGREGTLTPMECKEIAETLMSVLNDNLRYLNIRKVDLQFWDYLHDRAITTFHGGYHLGQGLKEFGVRNSRDADEVRRASPWNKEDAEKHDAKYDRENSAHNILNEFELLKTNEGWHIM